MFVSCGCIRSSLGFLLDGLGSFSSLPGGIQSSHSCYSSIVSLTAVFDGVFVLFSDDVFC